MARGDMSPQENFGFRPSEIVLVPFWGETARDGRPTAKLVIVFEVKLNARTMAPLRSEAWEKIFLAGYCIRSIVALWS